MEQRYSLRFETGERRGESIPITGAGITVGRKPGNTLQILDNSVSGKHAELSVQDGGVLLKDLGSTNGTRVGTQRVLEQRLVNGDVVLFGNIKLTFVDAQSTVPRQGGGSDVELEGDLDAPRPALEPGTASAVTTIQPQPDGLGRVSSELLARAKSRSFAGGIVVIALALVGGGLYWWLNRGGGQGSGPATRAVEDVPGNLLADGYSFEGDTDAWTPSEGSPAAFLKSATARRSGAVGVEASLAGGDWALHRSAPVRANPDRELTARAFVRAHGAVEARVGIEFSNAETAGATPPGPIVAWAKPVRDSADFTEVTLPAGVPPGYSEARVVLLARAGDKDSGGGEARVDDVSLVEAQSPAKPQASSEGAGLFVHGDPPVSAHLFKIDRVLFSGLAFAPAGDVDARTGIPLSVRMDGARIIIAPERAAESLVLRAESPVTRTRIASIAKDGYRTHALDFERTGVESLLLGSGADLVRLKFPHPVDVRAQAEGAASRVSITGGALENVEVQLDFNAERKEAGNLAHAARAAEEKSDLGGALLGWARLLDGYPFEEALVSEAEAARARLVQRGLTDLHEVQAEVERARFFRLADLYRRCREKALAVGARYKQSEVEKDALKLAADVEQDIALLETDLNKTERARLGAILKTLEAQKADGLAGEVRAYLSDKLGEKR